MSNVTSIVSNLMLPEDGIDLSALVTELQQTLIEKAMERANGNRSLAARLLGLKRTTLIEKLRRMGGRKDVAAETVDCQ
jgi:sigma-54 specific flagellar transcriptional regulator A